jgi:hypothetical protein
LDAAVFVGLVTLAIGTRLVMWAPNFHAVTAAALFAGFYFRSRAVAAGVPLVTMLASDSILGGYNFEVMIAVYAALVLPIAWRSLLRKRMTVGRVAFSALASCLLFYLVTNAAVWHAGIWYTRGWDGLLTSYAAGLPFLANALAGDLLFSTGLFGAYAWAVRAGTARSRMTATAPLSATA